MSTHNGRRTKGELDLILKAGCGAETSISAMINGLRLRRSPMGYSAEEPVCFVVDAICKIQSVGITIVPAYAEIQTPKPT